MRRVVLALAALTPSCLQGDFNIDRVHQKVDGVEVAALRAGEDDLADVLQRLGAPLFVRELGDGAALAYGWLDSTNWNVEAQVPVGDGSFQFTYADTDLRLPGLVVFLDSSLVVTRVERGLLRDLLPTEPRPQLVEQEASSGG